MDPELYEDLGYVEAHAPPFEVGGTVYEDAVRHIMEAGAGAAEEADGMNVQRGEQGMEDQIFLWAMGIEAIVSLFVTVLGMVVLWRTFCRRERRVPGEAEQGRKMAATASTSRRVVRASLLPTVAEEEEELEEVVQGPERGYVLRSKNKM